MNFLNKLYLNQLQNHFFLKGGSGPHEVVRVPLTGEEKEELQMQAAIAATAATAEQEQNMTPEQLTARRQEEARRREAEEGVRRRQEEALRRRQEREVDQMMVDPHFHDTVASGMIRIVGITGFPRQLANVTVDQLRQHLRGHPTLAIIPDERLRRLMQEIWRGIWNDNGLEYNTERTPRRGQSLNIWDESAPFYFGMLPNEEALD